MQAFPDNAARREVEALAAVCPNEGCTWTGTIKEFEVHLLQSKHIILSLMSIYAGGFVHSSVFVQMSYATIYITNDQSIIQ